MWKRGSKKSARIPLPTLEQLKEIVVEIRESQEKIWRAIDGMSKEIQELVQRDVGIEGEE